MNEYWSMILQFIFATIRNWLGWFLGGYDGLLFTLILDSRKRDEVKLSTA